MAVFEFELWDVANITPWGVPPKQSLSWFALTMGAFRMPVGNQVLFQYSPSICAHWGMASQDADYQVHAFARDMLIAFPHAITRLPPALESLAADWDSLRTAYKKVGPLWETAQNLMYLAWRWLGERSPWTSYLTMHPEITFLRVGDDVRICWDNRDRIVDGIPVWTATSGVYSLPVAEFEVECRDFVARLCDAMAKRIEGISAGNARTRIPLDAEDLQRQHRESVAELNSLFQPRTPDIPWDETIRALDEVLPEFGLGTIG
jgi:hypothetical protein